HTQRLDGSSGSVSCRHMPSALSTTQWDENAYPGYDLGNIVGGTDGYDAWHLHRSAAIHGADARVRHGRAAEGDVEGAVGFDVVRVSALPGDEAPVLDPAPAAADVLRPGTRILITHHTLESHTSAQACPPRPPTPGGRATGSQ